MGAAAALYVGLAVASLSQKSATYDEAAHLPAGYTYLVTGDYRLNPEHPPLLKLWAAAPLLLADVRFDPEDHSWKTGRQWQFGRQFLYRWNDADHLLLLGRLPVVALGLGLALAVFAWARVRFGLPTAALALLLCVLSPDVLAHGRIVTTDLALALFVFLAVLSFEALTAEATPAGLLACGLATGAAFACKYSGVVLVPILVLLGGLAVTAPEPMATRWRDARREIVGLAPRLRHLAALLLGVFAVAWLVIWASYGFSGAVSPDPVVRERLLATSLAVPEPGPVGEALLVLERAALLPEAYVRGALFAWRHAEGRSTFLLGELSERGFPHFFLVSFLVKTPLPLLVLLGLALLPRARAGASLRTEAFLWLPVLAYAAFTLARSLNIGHRHLLPVYPFLFVLAGRAAALAWPKVGPRLSRLPALTLVVLAGWYAVGTLRLHPHYLAFFNEAAGGPANGWKVLVDSSLDWGQDLPALKRWMDAHGVQKVKLSYFGSADPGHHGIEAELLPGTMSPRPSHVTRKIVPGEIVAVSATNLQGVYLEPADRLLMARLRALSPVATVGHSLFVFRADFRWPPPQP